MASSMARSSSRGDTTSARSSIGPGRGSDGEAPAAGDVPGVEAAYGMDSDSGALLAASDHRYVDFRIVMLQDPEQSRGCEMAQHCALPARKHGGALPSERRRQPMAY